MSRPVRLVLIFVGVLLVMQLAAIVADAAIVNCYGPLRYCDDVAGYLTTVALGSAGAALASVLLARYSMEVDVDDADRDGDGPSEPVPPADPTGEIRPIEREGPPPVARAPTAGRAPAPAPAPLPAPAATAAAAAGEAAARLRERKRAVDVFHTLADFNVTLLKELSGQSRPIAYPYAFLAKAVSDTAVGGDPLHGIGAGVLELARVELDESVKKGLERSLDDAELFGMRAARLLPEAKAGAAPAPTVAGASPDFGPIGVGRMRDWRPGSFARAGAGTDAGGRREALTSRLSHATRYVGLAHAARGAASECVVLFEPATSVALLNTADGVQIVEPAPLADLVDDLRALLGPAEVTNPFSALLPHAQGLALAAVIDLERERLLVAGAPAAYGAGQVARGADRDDRQLLAAHLRGDLGVDWGSADIAAALDGLAAAGWLAREGEAWLPTPGTTGLAWRFLVLERVLRVRAGRVGENGALAGLDLLCVLGLAGDLLLVERDEEHLRLSSTTGPDLAEGVGRLLLRPEAVTDLAPSR